MEKMDLSSNYLRSWSMNHEEFTTGFYFLVLGEVKASSIVFASLESVPGSE